MHRVVVETVDDVPEVSASGQRIYHRCNLRAWLDRRGHDRSFAADDADAGDRGVDRPEGGHAADREDVREHRDGFVGVLRRLGAERDQHVALVDERVQEVVQCGEPPRDGADRNADVLEETFDRRGGLSTPAVAPARLDLGCHRVRRSDEAVAGVRVRHRTLRDDELVRCCDRVEGRVA
jgi:hypothetical protein